MTCDARLGPVGQVDLWRLGFRRPAEAFEGREIAVIGGTEAFGRGIDLPLARALEQRVGRPCADLTAPNAGLDAVMADPAIGRATGRARVVVLGLTGAHLLRNPFYDVHRFRNDRVVRQTDRMAELYPGLDFFGHHFVGHMLQDLQHASPKRFAMLRDALCRTWVQRMGAFLGGIDAPVIGLWLGDRHPDDPARHVDDGAPAFVTRHMTRAIAPKLAGLVEVVAPEGLDAAAHDRAAERLAPLIGAILDRPAPARRSA
ncbi:hypothetical protein E2L08_13640 [Palleronia sediminis]|uniref:DUF6473 domain-containing protein n=1 Tax=Palleronia sediminis TaxID=2547833 RepID=A0A4R6A125_9RHOB|nr:DUF6473 family protein [Palleronia sediminis]TDL76282.1 hypothetical protein E2L08_13640 [Palleronia sediminis]